MRDRREQEDLVGSGLGRAAADLGRHTQIGVDRQVRPVILERGDRDQADEFLACGLSYLGPAQTFVEQRNRAHWAAILLSPDRLTPGLPNVLPPTYSLPVRLWRRSMSKGETW